MQTGIICSTAINIIALSIPLTTAIPVEFANKYPFAQNFYGELHRSEQNLYDEYKGELHRSEQNLYDEYKGSHSFNKTKGYQLTSSNLYHLTDIDLNKVSKRDNERKMSKIAKLRDNWNGYNAKAISKEVIEKTNKILYDIIVQPKIFPTPNNSIQFEFYDRNDLSKYLEFDISYDEILCNDERISPEEINQKIMVFYGIG